MTAPIVFKPRPSFGYVWLGGIGVSALALIALPGLLVLNLTPILLVLGLMVGLPFLALAAWFPTIRYELDGEALTLRYGPVLRYRIPLKSIRKVERRDLSLSVWASMRMPGLALFTVQYADVGRVKMCATRAAEGVLLIETDRDRYGLTPADEQGFVAALMARLPY